MTNLRKALLADHAFRFDIGAEVRAERAVAVVAAWLRDEADWLASEADKEPGNAVGRRLDAQARGLERLAASLTLTTTEEEESDG